MKSKILILAAVVLLAACGGNSQKKAAATKVADSTAQVPDMSTAEIALDYQGTYTGLLPAADCPGIETHLDLHKDNTFNLLENYVDRDTEIDTKGTYTVKGNLLTLSPQEHGTPRYYKVEENRLRQLDADQQPVTGKLANNYVLNKIGENL